MVGKRIVLPYVNLPDELCALLKIDLSGHDYLDLIQNEIKKAPAISKLLNNLFKKFTESKGLVNALTVLGWPNFRDRWANLYLHKLEHGFYSSTPDTIYVRSILELESKLGHHCINGISRVFLLGFYLNLAKFELKRKSVNNYQEITLPDDILIYLKLSQVRSEKIDWLILILTHFSLAFGTKSLLQHISSGMGVDEIFDLLDQEDRELMISNLLSYGASINEKDMFFYNKI